MFDAAIVGAGPAGLTAALYLARFHLNVILVDSGRSRAALIPKSHNQPFWPEGLSGVDLLQRMRKQTMSYPIETVDALIERLLRTEAGFELTTSKRTTIHSKSVIIATGVENRRPALADDDHARALASGLLRYCPICDGFEVTDRTIGVLGKGERAVGEAKFLRSFTAQVSVFPESGSTDISAVELEELRSMGVEVLAAPTGAWKLMDRTWEVPFTDGVRRFESIYPALGSKVRSSLAVNLGANATEEGCLVVDAHQRTSVSGLYAAGDVVLGLDQIGSAIGQATVAAVALRNDLCKQGQLPTRAVKPI